MSRTIVVAHTQLRNWDKRRLNVSPGHIKGTSEGGLPIAALFTFLKVKKKKKEFYGDGMQQDPKTQSGVPNM